MSIPLRLVIADPEPTLRDRLAQHLVAERGVMVVGVSGDADEVVKTLALGGGDNAQDLRDALDFVRGVVTKESKAGRSPATPRTPLHATHARILPFGVPPPELDLA